MASKHSGLESTLNKVYFAFFAIHIPVILFIDLVRFYPEAAVPSFSLGIRDYYIETFRDKFFSEEAPAWFTSYLILEGAYHLPISVWMLNAILESKSRHTRCRASLTRKDHPWLSLNLLIFGVQTGLTTFTCLVDMLSWAGYSIDEQAKLCSLYVPYLALAAVMGVDAFFRLTRVIDAKAKSN